jgi:hypothetical protein
LGEPDLPGFYSRQTEKSRVGLLKCPARAKPWGNGNKPDGDRVGAYEQGHLYAAFSSEEKLLRVELLLRERPSHQNAATSPTIHY